MLLVILASVARLLTVGPPLPLEVLVGAPALLAAGIASMVAALALHGRGLPPAADRVVAWLRTPAWSGFALRGELLLLGLILLLFALVVARLILIGAIFGFDESIYALTARWWVQGTPNTGWSTHRSPAISVLGIAALPFGTNEAPFRVVGLLFGLGALAACWRLGRAIAGPAAGLLAALAVATIPDLQLNAAAFLTDVPSATLVVVLTLLAWRCLEPADRRQRIGRAMPFLALLAAAAFYVRYGSVVPIAFLAGAMVLLWPRTLIRAWREVLVTAALLVVLLVPHFLYAMGFGAPWTIILSARDLAAPAYPGQALQVYLGQFFSTVAAPIAGAVATSGLLATAGHLLRARRLDRRAKGYLLLILPALGAGLLLGVVALAQTRYVYVPIMLLVVAGAVGIVSLWRRLPPVPRGGSAVLAVTIAAIVALNVGGSTVADQVASAAARRDVVVAAERIRADALSRTPGTEPQCSVLAYLVPEVTWYSGCTVYHFGYPAQPGRTQLLTGPNRYLLLMEGTTIRQPQGPMLDDYLKLVDPQPVAVVRDQASAAVAARIYRFAAPSG